MIRGFMGVLALFAAASAGAADPDEDERPANEARVTMARFADCVVGRRAKEAASVVLSLASNEEIYGKYPKLIDSKCLMKSTRLGDPMLQMPGDNFHFALAEALIRKDMAVFIPRDLNALPPLPQRDLDPRSFAPVPGKRYKPATLKDMAGSLRTAQELLFVRQFGNCVVRVDPRASHNLLLTAAATPAERAAIQLLAPTFSRCVQPGQQFKANIAGMRGTIALNFYRLVSMAQGVPLAVLTPSQRRP